MELIDIGANLTHESFAVDRDQVIAQAQAVGVVQMMITGASEQGSRAAATLAAAYPERLFATAGLHPHHAHEYTPALEAVFLDLLRQPQVKAVGECGLDYFRDFSPHPTQRAAFTAQLALAVDCGLPVFLHEREAHADFIAILREYLPQLKAAVVHCFTGNQQEMETYLELGCHIGITGWICDERRGHHLKALMKIIPAGRLMIETDAPYLKPRNIRPKLKSHRNEPRLLPWILGTVAAWREETPPQTARHTTATARAFFDLPEPQTVAVTASF